MFGWLKSLGSSDPQAKLKKAKDKKYDEAIRFQRAGDLRSYARLMSEIEALDRELAASEQS